MGKQSGVGFGGGNSFDPGFDYYPLVGTRQSSFVAIRDMSLIINADAVVKVAKTNNFGDFQRVVAWDEPADAINEVLRAGGKITVKNIQRGRRKPAKMPSGEIRENVDLVIDEIEGQKAAKNESMSPL